MASKTPIGETREWARIKTPIRRLKEACLEMKDGKAGAKCYAEAKKLENKLERIYAGRQ